MGKKLFAAAALVGAYAAVSIVLVRTPALYSNWKSKFKKKFPFSMSNIAHRGGSLIGPENTICAFERALDNGHADMLELDVHLSKDGQVVVSHDTVLARVCGAEYEGVSIRDIVVGPDPNKTLPQTSRSITLHFKTTKDSEYSETTGSKRDETTRLCLLAEVFDRFPETPLHVDIKDVSYKLVSTVMELIEAYNREGITMVGSSVAANKQNIVKYFASRPPETRKRFLIFANTWDFLLSHVYFYLGIMPFVHLDYDVFSAPVYTTTMWKDAIKEYGLPVALVGTYFMTTPVMWNHLRHRGIAVMGWVLNSESDYAEAARWPLDGVITDNPVLYHKFLSEHLAGGTVAQKTLST